VKATARAVMDLEYRIGGPGRQAAAGRMAFLGGALAEARVAEIMSISPETQHVQSRRILGANLRRITNPRADAQA